MSGPNDVLIEIAYAGICHSDIHTVSGDWGPITYPLVVGHEVVGTVIEVGAGVRKHAVDRHQDSVSPQVWVSTCSKAHAFAKPTPH